MRRGLRLRRLPLEIGANRALVIPNFPITQFGVVQTNSPKFFLSLSVDCIKMRTKACSIYNENVHSGTGIIFNPHETEGYSKFANAQITRVLFLIPMMLMCKLCLK